MKTLNLNSICALLVLVFGVQAAFAEKLIVPKQDDKKKVQAQSGGGDTGGGTYMTSVPEPLNKVIIPRYIEEAEFYLPYVMRFVDQFFQLRRNESVWKKVDGKMYLVNYSESDYRQYIKKYQIFKSTRDQDSIYEVLKHIKFVLRDKCFNKFNEEVAASVVDEKANDVCVSSEKILDPASGLNSENLLPSLVALFAHEITHKVGITEEEGPDWVQSIVLTHFKPTKSLRGHLRWTAENILEIIENSNKANLAIIAKAEKSLSAACFQYGFNFMNEIANVDAKMYTASLQGMSFLSYDGYVNFITSIHILILSSSFCLDGENLAEMMDPRVSTDFLTLKPGQTFVLPARREAGTLHSRPVETVKVGVHDLVNLRKVYQQTQYLMNTSRSEVQALLSKEKR